MELHRRLTRVTEDQSVEAVRERCKTLKGFVREAWPVIEPFTPFVPGWHIDAICDHLEACTRGDILRFLCNVPFGMAKSVIFSVMWSAWEWGPAHMPHLRIISTSYKDTLTTRDSRKMLDLVSSEWYQRHFPHVVLTRSGEGDFANTAKGSREAVVFRSLTGGRGDRLIMDDPHSTEGVESPAELERTQRIFRESVPSRINNPKSSVIALVMQRLRENDLAGLAMSLDLGYVCLMLPWEYEKDRHCITIVKGKKFFEDPRRYEGELIFPERFDRAYTEKLKKTLGPHAVAGQMQQRPSPREGKMFKRAWFPIIPKAPSDCRWVRRWDLADSEKQQGTDPDWSVGLLLGFSGSQQKFYISDVQRVREEAPAVRRLIKRTAAADGTDVHIFFPQDPGGSGKGRAKDLIRMMPGFTASAERETGSKINRAEPVASQASEGAFFLVGKPDQSQALPAWIEPFLNEVEKFPASAYKDQVDALSEGYRYLSGDAVFNASEDGIKAEPRRVPGHWRQCMAFDMDKDRFGAIWAAHDTQTDVVYLHAEYRVVPADLAIHKEALVRRGAWIPALFDLKGRGRKKGESIRIVDRLADQLPVYTVEMEEEAGIAEMQGRLSTGRLKVFDHLTGWFGEYRNYQRDDNGDANPVGDHLMKCTAMICLHIAEVSASENGKAIEDSADFDQRGEFGGNRTTGY